MAKRIAAPDETGYMVWTEWGWVYGLRGDTPKDVVEEARINGLKPSQYSVRKYRLSEVTPNKRKARA